MMAHHRTCVACHQDSFKTEKLYSSKSALDIRIVPGHPHPAWIECYANTYDENAQSGIAEVHLCFSLSLESFKK